MNTHYFLKLWFGILWIGILAGCTYFQTQPGDAARGRASRPAPSPILLTRLDPGLTVTQVNEILSQAGVAGPLTLPSGRIFYEARLLEELDQRQRLVLMVEQTKLIKSALIINFEDIGSLDTNEQVFAKILNDLNRRYGRPSFFYERGMGWGKKFSHNLVQDVSDEQFVRVYEWKLPKGVLRFGIPRRLDRVVQMEIQYADSKDLPPFGNALWSIDESFR